MVKDINEEMRLPSLDELFSSQEERDDAKLKRIYEIPISEIDPFPDHPFHVRDDEDMMNLVESVKTNGVITPATVRKKDDGRYELLSGHRRMRACELAGMENLRCEVVDMDRDEATVFMVESNFQRTTILPSEKAFAYKMRLEAMKRQGKRTDLTSVPMAQKSTLRRPSVMICHVIEYKGLKKGETYTAKGKLMDKATGEVIKDSSGKEITAERPFTAPAAEGRAFVTFKFDGSDLGGKETVVFETLYDAQGHLTAKHEDINDEGQTVTWKKPEIGTTLTDQKNNKSVVTSDKTVLIDTVEYRGLDTSQWYVVYGTLMVKDTGDPLVENGTPVAAMSKPFKPLMKNGKVKVEFEISTKGLEGKELVAFETAYRLEGYKKGDDVGKTPGVIVAEHKDLKDKGQTIKVVKPGTPIEHSPKTGDDAQVLVAAVLMLAAAAFAYGLYRRRKSSEDDSEETEE